MLNFDEVVRQELVRDSGSSYASASPFPHVVVDGLFDESLVRQLMAEFPGPNSRIWQQFQNENESKLGFDWRARMTGVIGEFMVLMNSAPLLLMLERLTGTEGLIPDPYFGGAGPHQILPGGFLKVHADFNVHPKMQLIRRLNLLLYLNENWKEEYGGHLELWSTDMNRCEKRIAPLANRTVVFTTTSDSFHGHPDPLLCPEGLSRRSLSFYYYVAPSQLPTAHDTLFRNRPGDSGK